MKVLHSLMCGGPKNSPRVSSIVQIIFDVQFFEISVDIQGTHNEIGLET